MAGLTDACDGLIATIKICGVPQPNCLVGGVVSVILSFFTDFREHHNNRMFPPRITSNTRKRMLKCPSMQPTTELTTLGDVALNRLAVVLLRGCSTAVGLIA